MIRLFSGSVNCFLSFLFIGLLFGEYDEDTLRNLKARAVMRLSS